MDIHNIDSKHPVNRGEEKARRRSLARGCVGTARTVHYMHRLIQLCVVI